MRGDWPYSLKPLRGSVDYAFSVFQSVRPEHAKNPRFFRINHLCGNIGDVSALTPRRLDALATKIDEILHSMHLRIIRSFNLLKKMDVQYRELVDPVPL